MKNIFKSLLVLTILLSGSLVSAADINLNVRSGGNIIFSGAVPLAGTGMLDLNDTAGTPHQINSDSVLYTLYQADQGDTSWSITDLQYYDSFGAFYLKCIQSDCDNWQFAVNNSTPFTSMDQTILSGGEEVYVYFGPQNRISLSSDTITSTDTLTVTTEDYDFTTDGWTTRTGATVGLTQPNPSDPFNPTEILTSAVNSGGIATFTAIPAGSYNVGVKEDYYFPTTPLTVTDGSSPAPAPSGGGGGGGSGSSGGGSKSIVYAKTNLDKNKAISFLLSKQSIDGSFAEDIYTDWVAIALAGENIYEVNKNLLTQYLTNSKRGGGLLTDYQRRAMSLMALGVNPYNANGENYIAKILASFDGQQFGSPNEDNDDIFALIVLQNAGFTAQDPQVSGAIDFVLSKQKENGTWDDSTDMTGAALQALSSFDNISGVEDAITKARRYLKKNQKADGGWSNLSATAWAMGGLTAIGEKTNEWDRAGITPFHYIGSKQDTDGGIKNDDEKTKIWETAYALTAISGKTWNDILEDFEKAETVVSTVTPAQKAVIAKKSNPVVVQKAPAVVAEKQKAVEIPNTASAIDALESLPETKSEKGWFGKLIDLVF